MRLNEAKPMPLKPGAWYITPAGRFLRLWGVLYQDNQPHRVVLHHLGGPNQVISMQEWHDMELINHPRTADNYPTLSRA